MASPFPSSPPCSGEANSDMAGEAAVETAAAAHGAAGSELTAYENQPELAVVSLLSLMSAFPARHSAAVADSVIAHLCLIADDERYAEPLRQCAAQLIETWDHLAELSQPLCCGQRAVH